MILIWKFAIIETAAFFLYFVATLFGNAKYELYTQLSFSDLLSYQTAKMIFLAGAQFALTVYAFLSWHYDHYTIGQASLRHASGVFFKKEAVLPLEDQPKTKTIYGHLGKIFHYGSLLVESGNASLVMNGISRPEKIATVFKQENLSEISFGKEPDLYKLLKEKEHGGLEFKSSLKFDYKTGQPSRDVEKSAMKALAAFLNSHGGYLVIGVNDTRKPLGLASDYQTLQRKDADGFENHFTQAFNSMIGPEFRNLIKLQFKEIDGQDVCVVQALPSPRPVYFKADNNELFYIRTGNISTALKLSEIESYSKSRWPKINSV